ALSAKARASLWKLGIGRVSRLAGWGWRICRVTRAQKRCPHHSGQHAETGTHYGKFGHGRLLPVSRQASDAFDWQFWCPLSKLCLLWLWTSSKHGSFAVPKASHGFPMGIPFV